MTDKLAERMAELTAALKRLEPETPLGAVARRNARTRVLAALRAVRHYVDEYHPSERKPPQRRRKVRPPSHAALHVQHPFVSKLSSAGVRIRIVGNLAEVPAWASALVKLNPTIEQLREARRSPLARKALNAARMLMEES